MLSVSAVNSSFIWQNSLSLTRFSIYLQCLLDTELKVTARIGMHATDPTPFRAHLWSKTALLLLHRLLETDGTQPEASGLRELVRECIRGACGTPPTWHELADHENPPIARRGNNRMDGETSIEARQGCG